MRTTLVLIAASISSVEALAAVGAVDFVLFLTRQTVDLFLSVFLQVLVHSIHVLDTKTGGKYCDLDLLAQFGIDADTPFDFEIASETRHEVVDIVHFLHHQTGIVAILIAEVYTEKYLLGVEYIIIIEQRRIESILDGFAHASFALTITHTHNGDTTVLKYGLHIIEVEIYKSVIGDYLGYASCRNTQCIVGLAEGFEHRQLGIDLTQSLVVDNKQCIDMFGHFLNTIERLIDLACTFKTERNSHNADCKNAMFF